MKIVYMTALMIGGIVIGTSQAATTGRFHSATPQKPDAAVGPCLLGSETCIGENKIPVSACRVTTKDPKTKAACAADGMRLIGKFTI